MDSCCWWPPSPSANAHKHAHAHTATIDRAPWLTVAGLAGQAELQPPPPLRTDPRPDCDSRAPVPAALRKPGAAEAAVGDAAVRGGARPPACQPIRGGF
jgi:hypothetical protein